ncbi:MAG: hypothetical protein M1812_003729 [Candelaria pacifica]|nr:MAG: hypothetical protein M1812_003729 [Candelaria pacifica]
MHVRMANDKFAKDMHQKACTTPFRNTDESLDDYLEHRDKDDWNGETTNIYNTIKDLHVTSRGTELPGHVNPTVLETLFAQQTTKWPALANKHLGHVIKKIWAFNDVLWENVCLDEAVRKRIQARLDPEMEESMDAAKTELQKILHDERTGPLITDNHYYADNLAKARAERVVTGLKNMGFEDGEQYTMNFREMTSVAHLSNEASAIHDIHDTLKAYCTVALKRFIDNVSLQVIERNLLGPAGPVNVFTSDYVGKLDASDLAHIAPEDFQTSNMRSELAFVISQLEKARKICSGKSLG